MNETEDKEVSECLEEDKIAESRVKVEAELKLDTNR
jgi:hypothetical protein